MPDPSALSHLDEYGLYAAAVVAGLTSLGWLARKTWKPLRKGAALVDRVERVLNFAEHELQPNSGSSLYDKIDRIEAAGDATATVVDEVSDKVDVQGTQIDELRGIVLTLLGTQAEANKAMWPAVEAVANGTPPE